MKWNRTKEVGASSGIRRCLYNGHLAWKEESTFFEVFMRSLLNEREDQVGTDVACPRIRFRLLHELEKIISSFFVSANLPRGPSCRKIRVQYRHRF